jgi:hypothetical protein
VSEVVRCEELPAQWEKYPLRTQREMMAGRNALVSYKIAAWADEGEAFLREQFARKGLEFHTSWCGVQRTITLRVYRVENNVPIFDHKLVLLFEVTEPAERFVSHLTITKIIMVM